ncbi:hypothetical protein M2132_001537 [Dysgonomonas sp. PH5-45]|nr:hypothetical protein [Dysgonomonas sp. PH5-45]MDH6388074.1 hypothetical protein [Dysgonomonas sp. PH5-37]
MEKGFRNRKQGVSTGEKQAKINTSNKIKSVI